jgi:hypothetical protein
LGFAGPRLRIETLEADIAKLEATAAVHRADFERERERCERLMAEVLKTTAELMAAREAVARIAGELAGTAVVAPLGHKLLAGIDWRRSGCAARLCGSGLRHGHLGRPDRDHGRRRN